MSHQFLGLTRTVLGAAVVLFSAACHASDPAQTGSGPPEVPTSEKLAPAGDSVRPNGFASRNHFHGVSVDTPNAHKMPASARREINFPSFRLKDSASPNDTVSTICQNSQFKGLWGACVDRTGSVYIADYKSAVIWKLDQNSTVSVYAGTLNSQGFADNCPAGQAKFNYPNDVAADDNGNIFVADARNQRIRKIASNGTVTTLAGSGAVQFYPDGVPFVAGGFQDGPASSAAFYDPEAITLAPDGTIFIADTSNNRIRRLTTTGNVSTVAGNGTLGHQDSSNALSASFSSPYGLDVDRAGNIFVCDYDGGTIRKIAPGSGVTTIAGTGTRGFRDGPGVTAQFNYPASLKVDNCGNIYIADEENFRVRKITSEAIVSTVAGNGTYGDVDGIGPTSELRDPEGLAIRPDGSLVVTEFSSGYIRQINENCIRNYDLLSSDPYFSPNNDNVKDVDNVKIYNISSNTNWTLSVNGTGTIATGTGPTPDNAPYQWDGKVNGVPLPDGAYTLRLVAGGLQAVAQVAIDTTPPIVTSLGISKIDASDSTNIQYTFIAKGTDQTVNGSTSGVEPTSLKMGFDNATFAENNDASGLGGDAYQATAKFVSAPSSSSILSYSSRLQDKAGNWSAPFNKQYYENDTFSGTSQNAFRTIAVDDTVKLVSGYVFYSKSGLNAQISGDITAPPNPGEPPIIKFRNIVIKRTINGVPQYTNYAKFPFFYVSPGITPFTFTWDGQYGLSPAPTGRYRVMPDPTEPWVISNLLDFKICDYGCIKREDWTNSNFPITVQSNKGKAHTLDGHIIISKDDMAPNSTSMSVFGTFDSTLLITPRPSSYVVGPAGPIPYNEFTDGALQSYQQTIDIINSNRYQYDSIARMAALIDLNGLVGTGGSASQPAKYAPVVLSNKHILWVKESPQLDTPGLVAIFNIFPIYDRGQLPFEAGIQ